MFSFSSIKDTYLGLVRTIIIYNLRTTDDLKSVEEFFKDKEIKDHHRKIHEVGIEGIKIKTKVGPMANNLCQWLENHKNEYL